MALPPSACHRQNPVRVKLSSGVTVTSPGLGTETFSSFAIVKKAP
jgi:hypothetical protein